MIKLKDLMIEAGGQRAGNLELANVKVETAKKWIEKQGYDLEQLPNFDANFRSAKKAATLGRTQRQDMPVIMDDDVRSFKQRLERGVIDITVPFANKQHKDNPFPEGLKGKQAKKWVRAGLKDGDMNDDKIKVSGAKVAVKNLKPIQKQIYFDKSMKTIIDFGIEATKSFLSSKTFFIISSDNYIIDGHHRFLAGMLIDPSISVKVVSINLPIAKLLPMTLAYGDAIGNKRNK